LTTIGIKNFVTDTNTYYGKQQRTLKKPPVVSGSVVPLTSIREIQ